MGLVQGTWDGEGVAWSIVCVCLVLEVCQWVFDEQTYTHHTHTPYTEHYYSCFGPSEMPSPSPTHP